MINRMMGRCSLGLCILIFLIAFPTASHASCEVTLQWYSDASNHEGYYVFGREAGQDYNYMEPWWFGDSSFNSCTFDDLEEGKTYYFVIRAYAGNNESADSNEVSFSTPKYTQADTSYSSGDSSASDTPVFDNTPVSDDTSVSNDTPTDSGTTVADNGSTVDSDTADSTDSAALSNEEGTSGSAGSAVPHKSSLGCFIGSLL
jgi:hypothetical protein